MMQVKQNDEFRQVAHPYWQGQQTDLFVMVAK